MINFTTSNSTTLGQFLILSIISYYSISVVDAFAAPSTKLDPVTYLRTEWVSAALCTNQTPVSADKVLQLGIEDGRVVNFVPRTVR